MFDNGPAYQLFALAGLGEAWPEALYNLPAPPSDNRDACRLHPALQRHIVPVASDPPHRRWHWKKVLPNGHPDYHTFDLCLQYALNRISTPLFLLRMESVPVNGHHHLYPEDDKVLFELLKGGARSRLQRLVEEASPLCKNRLRCLLRSQDVAHHSAFIRNFGTAPPDFLLKDWAQLLGANPYPRVAFFACSDSEQFRQAVARIGTWFQSRRSIYTKKGNPRKPEEGDDQPRTYDRPLLSADAAYDFCSMIREPMRSSLLGWGDAARRWQFFGLRLPEATTIVESGFYAHRVLLFKKQQKRNLVDHYILHAKLAAMFLNFSLLHRRGASDSQLDDKRLLSLLKSANECLCEL